MDGPGFESRLGARIFALVQTGAAAHRASYTMGNGSFSGVKRLESGVDHSPLSNAEINERVELYIYSPLDLRGLLKGYLYLYLLHIPLGKLSE
jgi:hypothetical protein